MALDNQLRGVKESVFIPFCRIASKWVSPMQLTVIGFMFGLLSPVWICLGYFVLGNLCWWINRIFDGMDGTVARITNQQTDFGGYIDVVCDFIIYSLLPISLVIENPSYTSYLIVCILEATFFGNAASLMYLSSILEKRALGSKSKGNIL